MYLLRIVLTLVVAASVVLGKPVFRNHGRGGVCTTVDKSEVSPEVQSDSDDDGTWPNGIVYYVIAKGVFNREEREMIKKAMADLERHGIRFKRRTNEPGYIELNRKDPECFAAVGYIGSKQDLNLGEDCMEHHIILHELMHALGFYHEHTRFDRDKFVKIVTENIMEDKKDNFQIRKKPMIYETVKYDFMSIMHYEWDEFAKVKDTPTIIPHKRYEKYASKMGTVEQLSKRDIEKLKIMYP